MFTGKETLKMAIPGKDNLLKPVTKQNILFHYSPILGLGSYTALSVNVMNPALFTRIIPKRDVTNVLLLGTMVGTGLYIYDRPVMRSAPNTPRIVYSIYGSLLFNFGSVLLWAVMRSILPEENKLLATLLGLVTGVGLTIVGQKCLTFVDTKVKTV